MTTPTPAANEVTPSKPCPFCGESAKVVGVGAWNKCSAVYCDNCEIYGPMMATKETAVFAWDRRPASAEAPARVDGLVRKVVTSYCYDPMHASRAFSIYVDAARLQGTTGETKL